MIKINKPPLAYGLAPQDVIHPGPHWVTVYLENIGDRDLERLSVTLRSLDEESVVVQGTENTVDALAVGEEEAIPFHIDVSRSGDIYVRVVGQQGAEPFSWESLGLLIRVNEEVAALIDFVAPAPPYPFRGTPAELEATVVGRILSKNLVLEFWAETPRGETQSLAKMGTEMLAAGEQQRYTATFTPEEEGIYILHAYLYDGANLIGHQTLELSVGS
jgi:hypothetical protein